MGRRLKCIKVIFVSNDSSSGVFFDQVENYDIIDYFDGKTKLNFPLLFRRIAL